ncbi:MAG: c-type cytochrome [Candidatus Baltobacteraceae bacterium]
MQRGVASIRAACAATILFTIAPASALAIPVFANGQGISCEVCHTTFPGMTRYGMMVMMTNFQTLNRTSQDQALPIAVRAYVTSYLANKDHPAKTQVSDLSYLAGGFLGRNFTWYAEQHTLDSGVIGDTEQLWLSWNGLAHGTNSLQLGKFHTPFPFMPAHAWTIGDYLLATQTTGQNDFNPNDARWGLAFNGMSNEFMYNVSYLTGSNSLGDALDYNPTKNPRTLDLNVSYGGMSKPWSVGLVAMRGFAPLHDPDSNAFLGSDAFSREGIYYGYQTSQWHFQSMYYHGFDAHPDIGEANVPLNGFMVEAERDLGWRNHVLLRYDVGSSDTLNRQYVLDVSHNLRPNLSLIGELQAGPQQRPQIAFQLAFAGPYVQNHRYLWKAPVGARLAAVGAAAASATPAAAAGTVASDAPNAGAALVQANGCAGCHGANLQGGSIGPKLYGIEKRLTAAQIADFIKSPRAPMPNFGFADAQIANVVAYLSNLDGGGSGARPIASLEPAMPVTDAVLSVTFPGTPPAGVIALPTMEMGKSTMQTSSVRLQSTSDPRVFTGKVTFTMGGPWVIRIQYDGQSLDLPVQVGS